MSTGGSQGPWRWAYRPPANLPQTATGDLFVVSGGLVRVAAIIGRVTTVLGATPNNGKFVFNSGTDVDLTTATALTSLAAGLWVFRNGNSFGVSDGGGSALSTVFGTVSPTTGLAVFPGGIALNTTANQIGQMEWYCAWLPLASGGLVVAA